MHWCPEGSAPCFDVRCDKCPHRLVLLPPQKLLTYRPTIYLDMDGVLADFDKRANEILGMDCHKFEYVYGAATFWHKLNKYPEFFLELPMMPDAAELVNAVWHLNPVVLTALPRTNQARVKAHKEAWIAQNFGGDMKVITCMTEEKPNYCKEGDVLVDDRAINRQRWEENGGRYVVHTSAADSVAQLKELKVIE